MTILYSIMKTKANKMDRIKSFEVFKNTVDYAYDIVRRHTQTIKEYKKEDLAYEGCMIFNCFICMYRDGFIENLAQRAYIENLKKIDIMRYDTLYRKLSFLM